MRSFVVLCIALLVGFKGFCQSPDWTWQELSKMPQPVTNNAVTAVAVNGSTYVYSFGGMDSTLKYQGITQSSYRYDVVNDLWDSIPPLPDTLGKIASAASAVKGRIYIIGGYHVFANQSEKSSNKVHVFDPISNQYLPDGQHVPIAIDDHVQAVWRDSLIYVVTGWSDNANVNTVQIYNPITNSWMSGTPVPDNSDYKVFGGSGTIIGDTIYYVGGASMGFNFPLAPVFRKGVIQSGQPDSIIWTEMQIPEALGYRMGASSVNDKPFWVGGSTTSYNFDADAYDGSGVVSPEDMVMVYEPTIDSLIEYINAAPPVMDLRGIGKISANQFIIAGGILGNQTVSDKSFLLTYNNFVGIDIQNADLQEYIKVYPNPTDGFTTISLSNYGIHIVRVLDLLGGEVFSKTYSSAVLSVNLNLNALANGNYWIEVKTTNGVATKKITVLK